MSAKARQVIADAVTGPVDLDDGSTVTVTGYPSRPSTPATWDAWPWLSSADAVTAYGFTSTWNVYVVLPAGDPGSTADAVDALLDVLWERLWAANAPITRVATGQLVFESNSPAVPALVFTVTV